MTAHFPFSNLVLHMSDALLHMTNCMLCNFVRCVFSCHQDADNSIHLWKICSCTVHIPHLVWALTVVLNVDNVVMAFLNMVLF